MVLCESAGGLPEQVTASGLRFRDIVVGKGPSPPTGYQVVVDYVAMTPGGKVFDSSLTRGAPYDVRVGAGQARPPAGPAHPAPRRLGRALGLQGVPQRSTRGPGRVWAQVTQWARMHQHIQPPGWAADQAVLLGSEAPQRLPQSRPGQRPSQAAGCAAQRALASCEPRGFLGPALGQHMAAVRQSEQACCALGRGGSRRCACQSAAVLSGAACVGLRARGGTCPDPTPTLHRSWRAWTRGC